MERGAVISPPWRRAVVTGASSGIGAAIARELAMLGVDLVLVARRAERLAALAAEVTRRWGVRAEVLVADLTVPDDVASVEAVLRAEVDPVDLLVNNAGFGTSGSFPDLPLRREMEEVSLNVAAVVRLSHAALGPMRRRGRGAVMNVSSLASYQPAPSNATYAATKAFVTSFSESLHEELRGTGVTVTAVLPGYTRTEFGDHVEGSSFDRVPAFAWMTAEAVAQSAVADTAQGRALSVPGWGYKLVTALVTPLPRSARRWIVGRVASRP